MPSIWHLRNHKWNTVSKFGLPVQDIYFKNVFEEKALKASEYVKDKPFPCSFSCFPYPSPSSTFASSKRRKVKIPWNDTKKCETTKKRMIIKIKQYQLSTLSTGHLVRWSASPPFNIFCSKLHHQLAMVLSYLLLIPVISLLSFTRYSHCRTGSKLDENWLDVDICIYTFKN